MSLNNQEAGDEVRSIIGIGKERRFLPADEEEAVLPAIEIAQEPEDAEHHLSTLDPVAGAPDEELTGAGAAHAELGDAEPESAAETSDLDLTPGALDKNNDPVFHFQFQLLEYRMRR